VDAAGLLRPLRDAPGLDYVGVVAQAVFPQGAPAAPVLQEGSGLFRFAGGPAAQAVVGQVAWCVDEETVTARPALTARRIPVGRIEALAGAAVRVNITGFAPAALFGLLAAWRPAFSLAPVLLAGLAPGVEYRLGVRLPHAFAGRGYAAELVCLDPAVGARAVIARNTAGKTERRCAWTLRLPAPAPPGAYGPYGAFAVQAHFEGAGWPGPLAGLEGEWEGPEEL